MNKCIVTTTINPPTEALIKYSQMQGWSLIVVGDKKTPHESYASIDCEYLTPEDQDKMCPRLSKALGWNTITRRNVGFVAAYRAGVDIIATVDDDNIPMENWGQELIVGREVDIAEYQWSLPVFDPLFDLNYPHLWHRGFPYEYVPQRGFSSIDKVRKKILVQAALWNGDPDIDAICRMVHRPNVEFTSHAPFSSNKLMPFNSQNTLLHRDVIPYYMMLCGVGRIQDVWGGYALQLYFPGCVAYTEASVYQKRNEHDLSKDLEDEIIQYRLGKQLVEDIYNWRSILPKTASDNYAIYKETF